jgi:hypothetical protein
MAEVICVGCIKGTADQAQALVMIDAIAERMRETVRLNSKSQPMPKSEFQSLALGGWRMFIKKPRCPSLW